MADSSEFPRLFLPLQGELLAYILSTGAAPADAEDVLQDAACVLLRKIADFQTGTNFRAWAYAVVKNEINNHFRKCKRRALTLDEETLDKLEQLTVDTSEDASALQKYLTVCLQKLAAKSRHLVDLRYTHGESLPAIARTLGRTVESVYVTMSRIRRALRRCVESRGSAREEMA